MQVTDDLPSVVEDIKYILDDLVGWDAIDDWELTVPTGDLIYVIETFGSRSSRTAGSIGWKAYAAHVAGPT